MKKIILSFIVLLSVGSAYSRRETDGEIQNVP